jgi:hypothetical protein
LNLKTFVSLDNPEKTTIYLQKGMGMDPSENERQTLMV